MTVVDLLGHVFYATLFVGQVLLTRRNVAGWALRLIGDAGWIVLGLYLGLSCVWAWGALFLAMDIRGLLAWGKSEPAAHRPT